MKTMSQEAIDTRNSDIANGSIKKEWLEDSKVLSIINALHEIIKND